MKNIDKYNEYSEKIDGVTDEFCLSFFPNGVPKKIFSIDVNHTKYEHGYYINEAEVKHLSYRLKRENMKPYFSKNPTNKDVIKIKEIYENLNKDDLTSSDVMIHVESEGSSWAVSFDDFAKGSISEDRGEMASLLLDKITNYIDNYLVKDGQFMCSYCRKAVNNDKKIKRTVFAAQYRNNRQEFDYCSDTCASHDQMGHEG